MEITHDEIGNATIVSVSGRVDSATAPKLESHLKALVAERRVCLVLDLAQTEYMSSAGLRTLVATSKQVKADSGDLRLCNPSARVAEVMRLAGLLNVFTIYGSQAEAVASFS